LLPAVSHDKFTELASHPHVLEVSVVARPHPKWGERPMAFVKLHPQHAKQWEHRHREFERDLKSHARKLLPGFACPEWVAIVDELPVSFPSSPSQISETWLVRQKTSTGKILKTDLRKVAAKL
jgi:acyl-CoA synthetase (AMP-forming)/AMP-acid ligase II